ncbi:MAG: hypothetical protein FJ280_20330 [Planctomycetes bacterium]|nr:hypothetical protein [Planctomycetota bacterium]
MRCSQRLAVSVLCVLLSATSGWAAITIEGVADKKVYADRVTFTVRSEAGYDFTATLNGVPVATDLPIKVDEAEYYELSVRKRLRSSGAEESRLVRFIVRATARGNTEWGLPRWTPYPLIDSAAAEFAGARLVIVTPARYPVGFEIPVIARVEDAAGARLGVNGSIVAPGFESHPLPLLRGVGSVFLPVAREAGTIFYAGGIQSLATPKEIAIESSTSWRLAPATITGVTDWGENARLRITAGTGGGMRIAAGATLTIGAGSVVAVEPGVEIRVEGRIVVHGTLERPVVFTCRDRKTPWGGFLLDKSTSRGEFTGTILTASGADPKWFDNNPGRGGSHRRNQCLFYLSNGANVTLTDCWLVENHGQAGHGEKAFLTMTRCLIQKCVTGGQYNGGAVMLDDCALIEFPSATAPFADADNDGLYLTAGTHVLTNCLIGWALDDGIDAGADAAGSVTIQHCWFESCYHEALAWSGAKLCTVTDTVTLNCGQGIECGYGAPDVNAVHCLSTANAVGARFGDNYDWTYKGFLTVRDSLLLFNHRDLWGRAWDNWTVHVAQMDIQDNCVTIPDADFPDNCLWDPQADPDQRNRLTPFLPTPAGTVGIGIATLTDTLSPAAAARGIPVRLSTFTTRPVRVDYAIDVPGGQPATGTLQFPPGATVGLIPIEPSSLGSTAPLQVLLSNPAHAELTGRRSLRIAN